jgi:diguanylate cyclase (GGDEF)-like protein
MKKFITTTPIDPQQPIVTGHYACLVQIYPAGDKLGQRYVLGDKPIIIGRRDDSEIAINDHAVSRQHARIQRNSEGISVSDLASTNGTFINDRPVKGTEVIRDGDYLRIGGYIFRFLAGGNLESQYHEEIYRLTIIDALTQIHNRRYLLDQLERELIRARRHSRSLTLVMFDIDGIKAINEKYGHLAGDYAIRELATQVRKIVGPENVFARYGGDEFAVVLVESQIADACVFAEKMRDMIERHPFQIEKQGFKLTLSIGIAGVSFGSAATTEKIIQVTTQRMLAAKQLGGNRLVVEDRLTKATGKRGECRLEELCDSDFLVPVSAGA